MKKYSHARVALLIALLSLNTFSSCVNTRQALGVYEVVLRPGADVVPFNPGEQLVIYDRSIIPKHNLGEYEKIMKSACKGDFMSRLKEKYRSNAIEPIKPRFVRSIRNEDQANKDQRNYRFLVGSSDPRFV